MKVLLHYEENDDLDLHKSLKITLPKSWKTGPCSNLLKQFVESYNNTFSETNPLKEEEMHLAQRCQVTPGSEKTQLVPLCSDAVILNEIDDRGDVYICHGPSQTLAEKTAEAQAAEEERKNKLKNTVACVHFGCQLRFPKGGPYPDCRYHKLPPVFHETAKYWACCPNKKAYDWDDFQKIPGCLTGTCTDVKEDGQKMFLGGTDLREQAAEASNLKSIDDFNKAQLAGGSEAAPVLDRLKNVMVELGVENELFEQVVEGIKKEHAAQGGSDAEVLEAVTSELGDRMKKMMKGIAVEHLRIK